jgi:hypothetical protein
VRGWVREAGGFGWSDWVGTVTKRVSGKLRPRMKTYIGSAQDLAKAYEDWYTIAIFFTLTRKCDYSG